MEVLWGAWVRRLVFSEHDELINIEGIYDVISKKVKADFPFLVDLQVVLAFKKYRAEEGRNFEISLEMRDMDGLTIISDNTTITVPEADNKVWYEGYEFKAVEITRPGYYELWVLVSGEQRQTVGLWVTAPKTTVYDPERDITTELWSEDYRDWRNDP